MVLSVASFHEAMEWVPRRADTQPDLTIVLSAACFSRPALAMTLASFTEAPLPPVEIIIVDDGAPGEHRAAIDAYAQSDPRVAILRFPAHRGIPAIGVNTALLGAGGRYVAYQTGLGCYRDDALCRMVGHADRTGAALVTAGHCWPDAGDVAGLHLDGLLHRRALLDSVGFADPHVLLQADWDRDLQARLLAAAPVACLDDCMVQVFRSPAPRLAERLHDRGLVAARQAEPRDTSLRAATLDRLDVVDFSFLPQGPVRDQFFDDVVAPYVARHWQAGPALHPNAMAHIAPCRPVRLAMRGGLDGACMDIAFGNLAAAFPDLLSYRLAQSADRDWPMASDDARMTFRGTEASDPRVHKAYRELGKPVIYAMDDDLVNLHEYPDYGEPYWQNESQAIIAQLTDADRVMLWSRHCADIVRPLNRAITILRTHVARSLQVAAPSPPAADGRLIYTTLTSDLGHRAGFWEAVIQEWAAFFREHRDTARLVLFGTEADDSCHYQRWFDGVDYELRPPLPFAEYIAAAQRSGFHAVLTQLREEHIAVRSKCPLKLLDATVCGAILIASDVAAYEVVENGVHGLKVPGRPGAWTEALELSLAIGKHGRARLWRHAQGLVERDFTTEAQLVPMFVGLETARLTAAMRAARPGCECPVLLVVQPIWPEPAVFVQAWAAMLQAQGVAVTLQPDGGETVAEALAKIHAPDVALVHAPHPGSPWAAAAQRAGLPCIVTADIADGAATPPLAGQAPWVLARSRSAAEALRRAGWTGIGRVGKALPAVDVSGALPAWRSADGVSLIGLVCGAGAELAAAIAMVPVDCPACPASHYPGGARCPWDVMVVTGGGAAAVDAALHAMATGALVIALNAPDLAEILQHRVNGWLVDRPAGQTLPKIMLEIAALTPAARDAVRIAGRVTAWTRTHDQAVLLNLLGLYRRVLGDALSATLAPRRQMEPLDTEIAPRPLSEWTVDTGQTAGWMDAIVSPTGYDPAICQDDDVLVLKGWAALLSQGLGVQTVLFSVHGLVVGSAAVTLPRPDVAAAGLPPRVNAGWEARLLIRHLSQYIPGPRPEPLGIWAVVPDSKIVVPLLSHKPLLVPPCQSAVAPPPAGASALRGGFGKAPSSGGTGSVARDIVVVLGMHRSGTSLCAHILSLLGVDMTDGARPTRFNQRGHWERFDLLAIVEPLLNDVLHRNWFLPEHSQPLPEGWWADPEVRAVRDEIAAWLVRLVASGRLVGFKDPRTSILLPMWQEIFAKCGVRPRYVVCVRDPAEVCASIAQRDAFDRDDLLRRWALYNSRLISDVGDAPVCVVPYAQWFAAPQLLFDRLARFLPLGLAPKDARLMQMGMPAIDPALRHCLEGAAPAMPAWHAKLYAAMAAKTDLGPFSPALRDLANPPVKPRRPIRDAEPGPEMRASLSP